MVSQLLFTQRFGRGAARLPLGVPEGTPSIASFAQAKLPGERFGTTLLCGLLMVGVLAISKLRVEPTADPTLAEMPTRIELDAWELEAPDLAEVAPVEPAPRPPVANPIDSPSPSPARTSEVAEVEVDVEALQPEAAPFDLTRLALRNAPAIPDAALDAPRVDRVPTQPRRPSGIPTSRSMTDLAIAVPPNAARAFDTANALPTEGRTLANPEALRPDARALAAPKPEATAEWAATEERRAFLAALRQERESERGVGSSHNAPPPVALAHASSAALETVRTQFDTELRRQGWHEVPLDELPDCSPPGRQDALKRRILIAAKTTPTCTNAMGSYRFLETRNLNAFLMWGRTNPDGDQSAGSPRDVCDVLSRALDCLTNPSMEEIGTR